MLFEEGDFTGYSKPFENSVISIMRSYPDFDVVYYYMEKSSDKVYDEKFMAQKKKKAASSEVISSSDGLLTDMQKHILTIGLVKFWLILWLKKTGL